MRTSQNSHRARLGRVLGPLAFFLVATVVLTWPFAVTPGQAASIRDDYFQNLWNAWWFKTALFELHTSPYWTDYLHFPMGISLSRHTLSPFNALLGALLGLVMDAHSAFTALLLAHFALGAWALFLLARYLTGSTAGSLLAGLVYSFCPFHLHYMAQIQVATVGFLPLAVLYFLKVYREGGARNVAMAALFVGLLAATNSYFLVYALLFAGLLALAGTLWDPRVPVREGLPRLIAAGLGGVGVAVLVAWPLVSSALFGQTEFTIQHGLENLRKNDLLGVNWLGPPEVIFVAWPTMLGYSTLLLLGLGYRGVSKQRFWVLLGCTFFVLSLGTTLRLGGAETGVPLPYALLSQLPGFSLLRKPDRFFIMIQLAVAVLCAFAWKDVARRLESRRLRSACWAAIVAFVMIELTGVPLSRFEYRCSPLVTELSHLGADSLIELPAMPGRFNEGRYNFCQTFHATRIAQGYVTPLALTKNHSIRSRRWRRANNLLASGKPEELVRMVVESDIDLVVLNKTNPRVRRPSALNRRVVWVPFFFVRRELLRIRQVGALIDHPIAKRDLDLQRSSLIRMFGDPVLEDDRIAVFRRRADR